MRPNGWMIRMEMSVLDLEDGLATLLAFPALADRVELDPLGIDRALVGCVQVKS